MRVLTPHIHVPASSTTLFDYISDVGKLPEWATEFIQQHEREGDILLAKTAAGDLALSIRSDRTTGVADIIARSNDGEEAVFPTRVIALPNGTSIYTFTMIQGPGQTDRRFDEEHASLKRELKNIRRRFAAE